MLDVRKKTSIQHLVSDISPGDFMQTLLQDLRYGVRMLMKKPGFTLITVLTLALGIGANTAIFSVAYAVMWKALPYQEPQQLVAMWPIKKGWSGRLSPAAPAVFLDWREKNNVFTDVAAYEDAAISNRPKFFLTGIGEPERIMGARVTVNLFSVLGVNAARGRTFSVEEEQIGREQVVLLSDTLWNRRFGADKEIVGKTIQLNDKLFAVIGVMPPDFKLSYPKASELWTPIPFGAKDRNNRSEVAYKTIARLKPDVTIAQAQTAMNTLSQELGQQFPKTDKDEEVLLKPLHEELFGQLRTPLLLLLTSVGVVLLIACVNVANLLLARTLERSKEIAVRAALGASRWRLIRQMLTESITLSLLGGTFGVLLAVWVRDLLVKLLPATFPRSSEVMLDTQILGFTVLLSFSVGILMGLVPILQVSKPDLNEALKSGVRSASASLRMRQLGNSLVIFEVALSLVLLVTAGLIIGSLWRLQHVELGFNPRNILTLNFTIPHYKFKGDDAQEIALIQRILDRVKTLPGVVSAACSASVPLRGVDYTGVFEIPGKPRLPDRNRNAQFRCVSDDYFRTMETRLLRGRTFNNLDNAQSSRVVVINEELARVYFPDEEVLGQRLIVDDDNQEAEIVGVVADVRHAGVSKPMEPAYYQPLGQGMIYPVCLEIRTFGDPLQLSSAVQEAIWAEDKNQPVEGISTMEEIVAAATADTKFLSILLGSFAFAALLLGALGIYGVLSYSVTQRTQEIGIRLALGAHVKDILQLIIGQGMKLVLAGLAIGLLGTLAITRLLTGLLYGVSATDPFTFVFVAAILLAVALFACWIPARRATKVDPIIALRCE
jgi:predicted permease